jgi:hypothetical protein
MEKLLRDSTLVVDQTGVGKAVVKSVCSAGIRASIRRLTILAGLRAAYEGHRYTRTKTQTFGDGGPSSVCRNRMNAPAAAGRNAPRR